MLEYRNPESDSEQMTTTTTTTTSISQLYATTPNSSPITTGYETPPISTDVGLTTQALRKLPPSTAAVQWASVAGVISLLILLSTVCFILFIRRRRRHKEFQKSLLTIPTPYPCMVQPTRSQNAESREGYEEDNGQRARVSEGETGALFSAELYRIMMEWLQANRQRPEDFELAEQDSPPDYVSQIS
uniref:Uncharacterized protein n=1 Tax=Moniliophthora roreri TaxID=221103 RepID=A0A0W0F4E8_MONRR